MARKRHKPEEIVAALGDVDSDEDGVLRRGRIEDHGSRVPSTIGALVKGPPYLNSTPRARRALALDGQPPATRRLSPRFPICYGPEFAATDVRDWIAAVGARAADIEPGSAWKNGCVESFLARMRDERLDGEIFRSLKKAQILIEQRRQHDNHAHLLSSPGWRPPAPEALISVDARIRAH